MDERHWWITSKLLESFSNGVFEGKKIIEDFMTSENTIAEIDLFLNTESNKVLLFCIANNDGKNVLALGNANIMASLLQENNASETVVYFLKTRNVETVSKMNVEQEINCGEIKQSAVISFRDLVQKNVMHLIQKHLTNSSTAVSVQESRNFLSDMNKHVEMLVEFSNATEIPQQVLNIPLDQSIGSFRKNRQNLLNPTVIAEYESYLQEWMGSIEAILIENNADERLKINNIIYNINTSYNCCLDTVIENSDPH